MLQPGSELQGRYQIVRLLGRGGMGAVYEARDLRLDTTVAVKDCRFDDPELVKQFEREARLLARLRHPAVTRVIDHFAEGEVNYLVMEFIPGDDLSAMMNKGVRFSTEQVLAWTEQLLDALDYLHSQQHPVIHRDIKPANLKLMPHGQIILLDFGLAKGSTGVTTLQTGPKSVYGYTPNYAPLEQIHGTEGTDARSDLYSLAATMYHLLTGVMPPGTLLRLAKTSDGAPDPLQTLQQLNSAVSPAVSEVFAKALAISRERRPSSAREMRELLRRALAGGASQGSPPPPAAPSPVQPRPTSHPVPSSQIASPAEPAKRNRTGAVLLLALLLAAVSVAIGTAVVLGMRRSSRAEKPVASTETSARISASSSGALRSVQSRLSSAGGGLSPGAVVTLPGHKETVRNIAFSPDSALLASASWDGTARIWDVRSRRELRTIRRDELELTSVAFSRDGKMLAVGGYNSSGSTISFYDPATGQTVREDLLDRSNLVSDVLFTGDGGFGAVTGSIVHFWDLSTGEQVREISGTINASMALSPDGALTAIGGTNEPGISLYNRAGRTVRGLRGHEQGILSIAFSPDGQRLASGSYDSTVRVWAVSGNEDPLVLKLDNLDKPHSLTWSPDGSMLAAGTDDQLRVWDMPEGKPRPSVATRCLGFSVAWSMDGRTLALGCSSGEVKLFGF